MKTKKILSALTLALILFSSCKKADVQDPAQAVTVNADGSLNVADADGAFYAVEIKNFDTYNGSTYDETQLAYAWFGKYPIVANAGIVKIKNIELSNFGDFYTAFSPLSFSDTLFTGSNATATWTVQGNTTSGIAGFTHTDNTTLPVAPSFTLPSAININNSLTINHTSTGGALGVLYTLAGDNGDTTKYVANSSSSITFTSAEIKSVAVSNGRLGISVMPVTYSSSTYGGKKYYFIKQYQYTRETVTL